jgi:hypothetical protein
MIYKILHFEIVFWFLPDRTEKTSIVKFLPVYAIVSIFSKIKTIEFCLKDMSKNKKEDLKR